MHKVKFKTKSNSHKYKQDLKNGINTLKGILKINLRLTSSTHMKLFASGEQDYGYWVFKRYSLKFLGALCIL